MSSTVALLKLALCGPNDVSTEIGIAKDVIYEWNVRHGEIYGFWVQHHHWLTDIHPDLGDRPQAVVNRQIIDNADVIIAIFWSRFGIPTGIADSGTEEEIRRGVQLGKKVLVYFSELEPLPQEAEATQINRLWKFRQELRAEGIAWQFTSRTQFRSEFANHLALALNGFKRTSKSDPKKIKASVQKAKGNKNVQVVGDGNKVTINESPPRITEVRERRPGSITAKEQKQIQDLIGNLAEGEVGVPINQAFKRWWAQLKNRFNVTKYEDISSIEMPEVMKWYSQQAAMQKQGYRAKAPDAFRNVRIGAIKTVMKKMGITEGMKQEFYSNIATRLRMKKPFTSLTRLTRTDLDRVYRMVLSDGRG